MEEEKDYECLECHRLYDYSELDDDCCPHCGSADIDLTVPAVIKIL